MLEKEMNFAQSTSAGEAEDQCRSKVLSFFITICYVLFRRIRRSL